MNVSVSMRRHLAVASSISCFMLAGPAHSQSGSEAAASPALEEVVVTSQRRAENLQDVPVSVTAFSEAALLRGNIKSASEYLNFTPNVAYTEAGQAGARSIGIGMRGVSSFISGENAFVNSIGIYIDEFSVGSVPNQIANPQLPDMQRVEVLRGPQGTYFGRNSLGGALNLTTMPPEDSFGGSVRIGGERYDTRGGQFNATSVLNVPVSDDFALRSVVYYEDSSGMVANLSPTGDDSGHRYLMARLSALWDISDRTTLKTTIFYSDEDQGADETVPSGVWDIDTIDSLNLNDAVANSLPEPIDEGSGFWPNNQSKQYHNLDENNSLNSTIGILNLRHVLTDSLVLKSISGVIDAKQARLFDQDNSSLPLIERDNSYKGRSWSTELRLESITKSAQWVVGALYAKDRQDQTNNVRVSSNSSAKWNGYGFLPPFPEGLSLAYNTKEFKVESLALFADYTWNVTDALSLVAGGRYTKDTVVNTIHRWGLGPNGTCFPPNFACFYGSFINFPRPISSAENTFDDISPRLGLRYQFNDDVGAYATVSKGYKAGGTSVGNNTNVAGAPAVAVPYEPEKLWNYEAGIKSELFDRRLRLNTSVFYLDWRDLQLEAFRFLTPGDLSSIFEQTINVQKARAYGAEVEFVLAASDRLTLSGGVGHLNSKITSSDSAEITGRFLVSLQGLELPKAPELTANFAAEYRWPIGTNEAWLRTEYIHRDGQYSDVEGLAWKQIRGKYIPGSTNLVPATGSFPFESPTFDLVNLRGGIDFERLELSMYVQNLAGETYYTGTQDNFGLSGIRLRPHPMVIGASVSYRF